MQLEKICECGSTTGELILTPETVHYGKVVCLVCRRFVKWHTAPKNEGERNSIISLEKTMQFHQFANEPFCFFCGRKKEQLGEHETLTIDHILKIEEAGNDATTNTQILCSACHKLKHWTELYMRKHLEAFYK